MPRPCAPIRGTLTEKGRNSPYRDRSIEENLDLFRRMKAGEFPDGSKTLRAKIDMASPNINMRDPVIYRIKRAHHIRTGDQWCIYPMYDYTHCISDALEGITHSLCTLEFEDHRPLYDWVLDQLPVPSHPRQIEFSRLELHYTVTSKRKLNQLVMQGHRRRLGRSAHAHHPRHAPARLHARRHPRVRPTHRYFQERERRRHGVLEGASVKTWKPSAARHGSDQAIEGGADQLPGRRHRPAVLRLPPEPPRIRRTRPCPSAREIWIEAGRLRGNPPPAGSG
jgi:hypothetical protein